MKKKVALHNLGCKVNAYELEAMQQILEQADYEIVPFAPGADIYIINTCTVTNIADRKSRQMLHKAKKMNPEAIVVAAGCYVQAAGEAVQKDPAIDVIIGNNKKQDLLQILEEYQKKQLDQHGLQEQQSRRQEDTSNIIDINASHEYEHLNISQTAEHTRAYIKIQDGCNQFCAYCIIPYARGRVRSRNMGDIINEVTQLASKGYQEVVLTGIHLSSYGTDQEGCEKTGDYPYGTGLMQVIKQIHQIAGVKRIRLGSLEPGIITQAFAGELAELEKVCPHFHLSMQSGCDATLARMNRRYNTTQYKEKCDILRTVYENPAITTDIIVGFPGETQEEFAATKDYVEKIHFSETHIFKYSKRQGTKAAVMENQVPEETKTTRSHILIEIGQRHQQEYALQFVGKPVDVLFEEQVELDGRNYWCGHTREYVKAYMESQENLTNVLVTCMVEETNKNGSVFLKKA